MRLRSRGTFIAAIGLWCSIIVLAPLLAEKAPLPGALLYLFFSPICHQLPERSFFLFSHQLPVCARCVGIYFGAFLGSFFAQKNSPPRWVLAAGLTPLVVDGGTQLFFRESSNVIRLGTGLLGGFVVVLYLYAGIFSDR